MDLCAVGERPAAALRPPTAPERRRGDDPDPNLPVLLERDQCRPDGHAARVVPRTVDRINDPASAGVSALAELLAEDPVSRTSARESLPDRLFDRAVRLGHRGQIRLGLDDEVVRTKAAERDGVGLVGELEREREIEATAGAHAPTLALHVTWRRAAGRSAWRP